MCPSRSTTFRGRHSQKAVGFSPTTAVVTDPTLPVIVESSTTTAPAPTVALPAALDADHSRSGPSAALLIGATGIGALAAGLAAWALQSRLRRRSTNS